LSKGRVREKRGDQKYERRGSIKGRLVQQEKTRRKSRGKESSKPSLEFLKM
jgi:hypothetical protein